MSDDMRAALEAKDRRIAELEDANVSLANLNEGLMKMLMNRDARIAELKAALKPFAENFGLDRKVYRHEGVTMTLVDDDILQRCCEAARAAYMGEKE